MADGNLLPLTMTQTLTVTGQYMSLRGKWNTNVNGIWAYSEQCDLDILERAFWQVVQDNDSLRLHVVKKAFRPYRQCIQELKPFALDRISAKGRKGFDDTLSDFENVDFPITAPRLFAARLVDCGHGAGGIQIRIHHLSCDGHSLGMFLREIDNNYQAIATGKTPGKAKKYSFADVIQNDIHYRNSSAYAEDKAYWKKQFLAIRHYSYPTGNISMRCQAETEILPLGKEFSEKILTQFSENTVSVQGSLEGLASLAVSAMSHKKHFMLAPIVHQRTDFKLKQTMGDLYCNVPMIHNIDETYTLNDYLDNCNRQYTEAVKHSRFPMTKQTPYLIPISTLHGFNYNHVWMSFSMMDYAAISRKTKLQTGFVDRHCLTTDVYLVILNVPGEGITLKFEYRPAKLSQEKAKKFLQCYADIANYYLQNPNITIHELFQEVSQ